MEVVYASHVYGFLEFIWEQEKITGDLLGRKILDCGAGGQRPPLGLFAECGFETYGIDISEKQIAAAREFCKKRGINVRFSVGDMRTISFDDSSFDIVYEYYSICHLTKKDTRKAISEMMRVVKNGGHLFLGFASYDTWPIEGEEREKGEFWLHLHGEDEVVQSFFRDDEIEDYLTGLKILGRDKKTRTEQWWMNGISKEDWMKRYADNWTNYSRKEWEDMYDERVSQQKYTHIFYILKKS